MVQNQFGVCVKTVRTDNGKEFFNYQWNAFLQNHGVIHQSSCVHTPQQNGVAERKHRHILDTARALKFQAGIPKDKFGPSAKEAVLIGYSTTQKGYRLFDRKNNSFFHQKSVPTNQFPSHIDDVFGIMKMEEMITMDAEPSDSTSMKFNHTSSDAVHNADNNSGDVEEQAYTIDVADPNIVDHADSLGNTELQIATEVVPAELSMAPTAPPPIRQSTRTKIPPIWMQDYLVGGKKNSQCHYLI
ncbi:uncharacterized protein [Nicotiana sylvestris]|uniref:uncharacterized protein n=1 Tax=Nicotiana sylvestris TaxID=4096 RepID=UPI00388C7990